MSPWRLALIIPIALLVGFCVGTPYGYYRCASDRTKSCAAFDWAFNGVSDGGVR